MTASCTICTSRTFRPTRPGKYRDSRTGSFPAKASPPSGIVEVLRRKGYAGPASLEMFSPAIQAMDPYQVAMKARATIEPLIA